jgi:hypothetical protein
VVKWRSHCNRVVIGQWDRDVLIVLVLCCGAAGQVGNKVEDGPTLAFLWPPGGGTLKTSSATVSEPQNVSFPSEPRTTISFVSLVLEDMR